MISVKIKLKTVGICLLVFSCISLIWGGIRIGKALSVKADSEGQYAYNEFQYSDMYGSILGGGYQQGVPVKIWRKPWNEFRQIL